MPKVDTTIGEGGLKLSGGEKQRISIARALLRRPKLLLFDEAASALDSLTEEEITNTIREISAEGRQITLLMAHRLSTILHADRIYVLEKGDIVETGSHDELLAEKGLYYVAAADWRAEGEGIWNELVYMHLFGIVLKNGQICINMFLKGSPGVVLL